MELNDELKKYLHNLNCRGCINRCPLDNPNCARSRIFINEAVENFIKK